MTRAQQLALLITLAVLALVAFGTRGPLRGGPGVERTDRYEAALGGIEDLEATLGEGRATMDLTGLKGNAEIRSGAGEVQGLG